MSITRDQKRGRLNAKAGDMTAVITEGGAAAGRTPRAPDIPDLTLPEFVLGAAYQHGGKRALVDAATGQELSYAKLAVAVRDVGAGLSARGIRPGDALALCTPNCLEFAVTWFAATSAGAIVTTLNPLCTEEEISRQLRQTGARWLVATAGLIEQKLGAVVGGTAIAETFVIGEGVAGTTPFGSLRATAGAPAARLGCRVKQAYGMTEVSGGTHIAPDDGLDRPESIGPALPGVECRVVEPGAGTDLGPDEPGELLVRTAGVMRGYLGDQQATAATIDADGWLHTGDIVTVDKDGWFYVTDRVKELIKYKAYQVAPAELEALLLTHPAVADAAVVRKRDALAGEVPKAFVVLRAPASADELMAWVGERLAGYKRVRQIEFTDHIPRSPAGKILRRLLVERDVGLIDQPTSPGRGRES